MPLNSIRVLLVSTEVLAHAKEAPAIALPAAGLRPDQRVILSDGNTLHLPGRVLQVVATERPARTEIATVRLDAWWKARQDGVPGSLP
jgi:hypothetical protein